MKLYSVIFSDTMANVKAETPHDAIRSFKKWMMELVEDDDMYVVYEIEKPQWYKNLQEEGDNG